MDIDSNNIQRVKSDPIHQASAGHGAEIASSEVDLQALADAICILLIQELRLERERLGAVGRYQKYTI